VQAAANVYEIWAQEAAAGNSSTITDATYWYCHTEKYSVRLASGRTYVVESPPSDAQSITTTSAYGVLVTLPNVTNGASDGVFSSASDERFLTREVYRSTSTGSFPDVGRIAVADDTAGTVLTDTFESPYTETTLGAVALPVVYVGNSVWPIAGQAPAFLDATLHNGSIVAIPKDDPYGIMWTPKGFPDYWTFPHQFKFALRDYSDEGVGITSVGDKLLVFLRSAVIRLEGLPMATAPNFNLDELVIDPISPSEGLAGTPLAYCHFHSQKGHAVVGWVSDSGIWMTDGTLLSERGLGLVRLTSHKDWRGDVDTSRLDETVLSFDPVMQALYFDYYDTGGTLRTELLHISPLHWVQSGEDQMVPKSTGLHSLSGTARAIGENGGVIRHWCLDEGDLKIYSERVGTQDDTTDMLWHLETGWIYPAGANTFAHVHEALFEHSDWGASEVCDFSIYCRDDKTGNIQHVLKAGRSLRGERLTGVGYMTLAGRAFKIIIRGKGKTVSDGSSQKSLGPIVLEAETGDTARED
jgi:hypothetical protein